MRKILFTTALFLSMTPALYAASPSEDMQMPSFRFTSINGGEIGFSDWPGKTVLVANTASLCGFTPQYADLQTLYDTYRQSGLVVVAIPSDDFQQELDSEAEVKDFCAMTFGLDLPMSAITSVKGAEAHPFYQWLQAEYGFEPNWNFNKVLIGADGAMIGSWGSAESPTGPAITAAVEGALGL